MRMKLSLCLLVLFVSCYVGVFGQTIGDCTLVVPLNPLTREGLQVPYITDPATCTQSANPSFVQGACLDVVKGTIFAYNPLVVENAQTQVAITPTVITGGLTGVWPTVPVCATWFGTNGNTLTLLQTSGSNTLEDSRCVNGLVTSTGLSIFTQFAYCNAPSFFATAQSLIQAGLLTVPPLGTAVDGQSCPTVRDFFVVDMDQSDNVVTTYIMTSGGQFAQNTSQNLLTLQNLATNNHVGQPVEVGNPSDNALLFKMAAPLGCSPWKIPDLAAITSSGGFLNSATPTVGSLPTNELQASLYQGKPVAYVSSNHVMATVNTQYNIDKVNLYRAGVGQPIATDGITGTSVTGADPFTFCENYYLIQPLRLLNNKNKPANFVLTGSPVLAAANNLFTFLASRYNQSFGPNGLNCQSILGVVPPVLVTINPTTMQATDAQINPPVSTLTSSSTTTSPTTTTLSTTWIIVIVVLVTAFVAGVVAVVIFIIRRRSYY